MWINVLLTFNKAPLHFILCLPVWNTWYFLFISGLLCVSLPFIQRNDRNLSSFVPQTGGNVETFMSTLKTLLLKVSLLSIGYLHKCSIKSWYKSIIRHFCFDMVDCWARSDMMCWDVSNILRVLIADQRGIANQIFQQGGSAIKFRRNAGLFEVYL